MAKQSKREYRERPTPWTKRGAGRYPCRCTYCVAIYNSPFGDIRRWDLRRKPRTKRRDWEGMSNDD